MSTVYHVPQLKHNLLFVKKLCDDNHVSVCFDSSSVCAKDKTLGEVLLRSSSDGTLYPISPSIVRPSVSVLLSIHDQAEVWHRSLGHSGNRILK